MEKISLLLLILRGIHHFKKLYREKSFKNYNYLEEDGKNHNDLMLNVSFNESNIREGEHEDSQWSGVLHDYKTGRRKSEKDVVRDSTPSMKNNSRGSNTNDKITKASSQFKQSEEPNWFIMNVQTMDDFMDKQLNEQ